MGIVGRTGGGDVVECEGVDGGIEPVSHTRAREALLTRAHDLQRRLGRAPTPLERYWFIHDARRDDLYVRGQSSADLAEVWGYETCTIERDASEVEKALKDPKRLEETANYIATATRRRAEELYERSKLADDRNAAPLASAAGAELERLGKVSGAITSGNTTNLNVAQIVEMKNGQMVLTAAAAADVLAAGQVAFRAGLAAYLAAPGDDDGAEDVFMVEMGKRLTGNVGQLLGGGER